MNTENLSPTTAAFGSTGKSASSGEQADAHGTYQIECRDANGNLKWTEHIDNLVTTQGKNDVLDKYFSGAGYTAAWYVGLISATSYAAGILAADTAAVHAGWVESDQYTQPSRPIASFSAATGGVKALASAASFAMNANVTLKGCFVCNSATKSSTTGVLYSAGLFSAGDKVLQSGDTINVSYSSSL